MTEFIARNWPWIVFVVLFVAMHRSGHGCGMHGGHGHGGHGEQGDRDTERPRSEERSPS